EGLWKRKFDSATNILNRTMTLNGTNYVIVGVVPAKFRLETLAFHEGNEVYVPLGQWNDPVFYERSTGMGMKAVGRLKPGVTIEQARADMEGIGRSLAERYPVADKASSVTVMSLKDSMVQEIRPFLWMLMAAVGFVLLIACVNVANLF